MLAVLAPILGKKWIMLAVVGVAGMAAGGWATYEITSGYFEPRLKKAHELAGSLKTSINTFVRQTDVQNAEVQKYKALAAQRGAQAKAALAKVQTASAAKKKLARELLLQKQPDGVDACEAADNALNKALNEAAFQWYNK